MNKKVLMLSGSPRKGGNSDLLCDQFMLGAKEAGNQTEKIFLRDKKIGYCTGCETCYDTHKCVQKDDIFHHIGDADYCFSLLEHGSRCCAGRCEKRLGRIADHARACQEYGVVSKVQRGWHKGRRRVPSEGRNHLHQFYSGIIQFLFRYTHSCH